MSPSTFTVNSQGISYSVSLSLSLLCTFNQSEPCNNKKQKQKCLLSLSLWCSQDSLIHFLDSTKFIVKCARRNHFDKTLVIMSTRKFCFCRSYIIRGLTFNGNCCTLTKTTVSVDKSSSSPKSSVKSGTATSQQEVVTVDRKWFKSTRPSESQQELVQRQLV